MAGGAARGTHTARPAASGCGADHAGLLPRRREAEELGIALGVGTREGFRLPLTAVEVTGEEKMGGEKTVSKVLDPHHTTRGLRRARGVRPKNSETRGAAA